MSRQPCQVLYAKYNSTRRPEFRLTTEICESAEGRFVRKRAGEEAARAHLQELCRNGASLRDYYRNIRVIPAEPDGESVIFPYIKGQTLADAIDARGLDREAFVAQVNEKLAAVLSVRESCEVPFEKTEAFEALFGPVELGGVPALNPANVDSLFTNFVEDESGIHCIDCEWVCHFPVPVAFIRYRALLYLYVTQVHAQLGGASLEEMLGWFGYTREEIGVYWQMDDRFQQYVHGEGRRYIYTDRYRKPDLTMEAVRQKMAALESAIHDKNVHIGTLEQTMKTVIHDKDAHIDSLGKTIHDMKALVEAKEGIIHDKDVHIANQSAQIQALTQSFQTISNSFFWRVTKPARVTLDAVKRLVRKNEFLYINAKTVKDALRHGIPYALRNRRNTLAAKQRARKAGKGAAAPEESDLPEGGPVQYPGPALQHAGGFPVRDDPVRPGSDLPALGALPGGRERRGPRVCGKGLPRLRREGQARPLQEAGGEPGHLREHERLHRHGKGRLHRPVRPRRYPPSIGPV